MPREIRKLQERIKRFKHVMEVSEIEHTELLEGAIDQVEKVKQTINDYNEILRQADDLRDQIDQQTRIGQDIHERLRMQIIGAFGRDSQEYQLLGGVRKSKINYGPKGDQDNSAKQEE